VEQLIKDYSTRWSLTDLSLIEKTATSHLYKAKKENQDCVLKLYTELGRKHEAIGPVWLIACQKSAAVVDVIEYDDGACLLDYIDGVELKSLIDDNKDDDATKIIAQTLQKIHTTRIPQNHGFKTFDDQFDALINHAKDAPNIILRAKKFLGNLPTHPDETRLLHGDTHHKNIMHHSIKGWIMLDPQALVGDRAYDCANTLHNPHQMPHLTEDKDRLLKQAHILGTTLNIDPQRIIDYAYIHGCLSSCWSKMDDGDYCPLSLKTSQILEEFISKD
jgi:streptomycin 6-kinase